MFYEKGFTLIEIMLVIVLMGILAAIGVPKLFGSIAKAKAAEVPVAAGTYISLQDAYISEGIALGSWKEIGYGAPSSQNFSYTMSPGANGKPAYSQVVSSLNCGVLTYYTFRARQHQQFHRKQRNDQSSHIHGPR